MQLFLLVQVTYLQAGKTVARILSDRLKMLELLLIGLLDNCYHGKK